MNQDIVFKNLKQSQVLLNEIISLNDEINLSKTKKKSTSLKEKLDAKIFCLRVILENLAVDIDLSIEDQKKS